MELMRLYRYVSDNGGKPRDQALVLFTRKERESNVC